MKEKLGVVGSIVLIVALVMFIATQGRKQVLEEIEHIKNNPSIPIKGLVTDKKTYKGASIAVRYKVGNKFYEEVDGIDSYDKVAEGDSILLIYAEDKPQLMITEFNDDFNGAVRN